LEGSTRKAFALWDASEKNVILSNEVDGAASGKGIVQLRISGASTTNEVTIFEYTNNKTLWRMMPNGGMGILKCSTKPDYIDGYSIIYLYSDGAGDDTLQVRTKIGATETETTLQDVTP